MKKAFLVVIFLSIALFLGPSPVDAACRSISPGQSCSAGQFEKTYVLTDGGSAQCTSGVNGTYTMCCDTQSEANAADSVRAPICGSSVELGKANSSCWTCGGDYRCAGLSFGLGNSDPFITGIRNPVNLGDTNTNEVWRIPHDQIQVGADGKFLYNGERYTPPNGDLIICNANVLGCGASDLPADQQYFSTLYPDEVITDANPEIPPGGTGGQRMEINALMGTNPGDAITIANPLLKFASQISILPMFIGRLIRYTEDRHFFAEALRPIGIRMDASAQYPLMPSQLQGQLSKPYEGEKLQKNLLPQDTGWRLCAPNSDVGGRGVDNIPLHSLNKSELFIGDGDPIDPYYYYKSVWSSQFAASVMGLGVAKGVDYYTPTRDLVPINGTRPCFGGICYDVDTNLLDNVLYPCEAQAGGPPDTLAVTKAAGIAHTGQSTGSFVDIGINWLAQLFGQLAECEDEPGKFCANARVFFRGTDGIAGLLSHTSQYIGMMRSDFSARALASDISQILDASGGDDERRGGFLRSFWASALPQFRYTDAEVDQQQSLSQSSQGLFSAAPVTRGSYPRAVAGTVEAYDCVTKNMIMPSALQDPQNRCTLLEQEEPWPSNPDRGLASWTPQSLPPDFQTTFFQGSVKDAIENATKDKIPACVLEGVKFIESGAEWIGGNSCIINQCGAAGPFQITVGVDNNGDPNCKSCGPSWADGSRTCPDSWPGNWPTDTNASSPCDLQLSANQAVQVLIDKSEWFTSQPLNATDSIQSQQEAIMLAADAYWGMTAPVERLDGCTYGEYVYKHCDPSYQCTGNPPYRLP